MEIVVGWCDQLFNRLTMQRAPDIGAASEQGTEAFNSFMPWVRVEEDRESVTFMEVPLLPCQIKYHCIWRFCWHNARQAPDGLAL
jgi:hypothetical protein